MRLRIESARVHRDASFHTLHHDDAGIISIQPRGGSRRPATFETRADTEAFRDAYPAHVLEFGLSELDLNAAVAAIRASRPVLTDASALEPSQEIYVVAVEPSNEREDVTT